MLKWNLIDSYNSANQELYSDMRIVSMVYNLASQLVSLYYSNILASYFSTN